MLLDLALAISCALVGSAFFKKLGAPGLLGMLLCGVLLGPSAFDLLGEKSRVLLAEFKTVALIVILIRAGLGIKRQTLCTIGGPALRMGFIPGVLEGAAVCGASYWLLNLPFYAAGMLGFIIAAVSPAVVVPQMLELKSQGYGQQREVPTLVLAGASLDDVFAITIFGVFAGMAGGQATDWLGLAWSVPTGIVLGAALGAGLGYALAALFRHFEMRDTLKCIVFILVAIIFHEASQYEPLHRHVQIAALLGIMAIGFVLLDRHTEVAQRLSQKFNKLWVFCELMLFVSIGSQVRLEQLNSQLLVVGLEVLAMGLLIRSVGVGLALWRSALTQPERLFCMIAYLPKATVQAAMGAVPLGLIAEGKLGDIRLEEGQLILAMAVLSIVVTAPLGAIAIRWAGPRLLSASPPEELGAKEPLRNNLSRQAIVDERIDRLI